MAFFGISRPEGTVPTPTTPPLHDVWDRRLLTGSLTLHLATAPGRYVSPATGHLVLTERGGEEIVALEGARAAGTPVLPGSGIKGAVRTIYELLSCSCNPFARGRACNVPQLRVRKRKNLPIETCEACSLFGCLGWNGRISFTDARPVSAAEAGEVEIGVEKVPLPWPPNRAETGGHFRHYDLGDTRSKDPQTGRWGLAPKVLAREVYRGCFETRLLFTNVTPVELGRLLLALGLTPEGWIRFHLRLGGMKYDGQGGVAVSPRGLTLAHPGLERLEGEGCSRRCGEWLRAALAAPGFKPFLPLLDDLAARLEGEAS